MLYPSFRNTIYKTIVLIIAFITCTNPVFAQTESIIQQKLTTDSVFITSDNRIANNSQYLYADGNYYIFPFGTSRQYRDSTGKINWAYSMAVYDEQLHFQKSKEVLSIKQEMLNVGDSDFETIIIWNNQLLLFTSSFDKTTCKLFYQIINKQTLLTGEKQVIQNHTLTKSEKNQLAQCHFMHWRNGRYYFSISPDGSKLGIYSVGSIIQLMVFDQTFDKLITDISAQSYSTINNIPGYCFPYKCVIDNEGNGYMSSQRLHKPFKNSYSHTLPGIKDSTDYKFIVFNKNKNSYLKDSTTCADTDINYNHIVCDGSNVEWILVGMKGIYRCRLDIDMNRISKSLQLFPSGSFTSISKDSGESECLIRNYYPQRDGGYIIIGEKMNRILTLSSSNGANIKGIYKDIVITKFDSKNNILWSKIVSKDQNSLGIDYRYEFEYPYQGETEGSGWNTYFTSTQESVMSFYSVSSENQIYLLLNDHVQGNSYYGSSSINDNYKLMIYKVTDSEIIKEEIPNMPQYKKGFFFIPTLSKTISATSVLLRMEYFGGNGSYDDNTNIDWMSNKGNIDSKYNNLNNNKIIRLDLK